MPEPGTGERVAEQQKGEAYFAILEKIPAKDKTPELTRRQQEIFKRLPSLDRLVEQLYGHIRNAYIDGGLKGGISTKDDEARMVSGEIAEILVTAEFSLFPLILGNKEFTLDRDEDRIVTEKLLGILHNPDRLQAGHLAKRNPDLAWMDTENRKVRVLGEVKTAKQLDQRSFYQLWSTGFEENVRNTINVLNADPSLGKEVFGSNPETGEVYQGSVADDISEVVFMPLDTDIEEKNWKNLLKAAPLDRGLYPDQRDKFLTLLRKGKVRLVRFSFSREEIALLTKEMMERIKEKYPA